MMSSTESYIAKEMKKGETALTPEPYPHWTIKEINEKGVPILLVEQNAKRALKFSDRGYVLDQGRNAYQGTGKDLLDDPRVVDLYLGKM